MTDRLTYRFYELLKVCCLGGGRKNVHSQFCCSDSHSPDRRGTKLEIMRKFALCFVLVWSFAGNGSELEVPFTDLSFEQAMEKSQSYQKMVFVNFYSDSCRSCKLMDRTTFKDPKVLEWLEKHAIPVSIDVKERIDLADRYFVNIPWHPTFLFIAPTGTTLDVVNGYRKKDEFISLGEDVLNGRTSIKKAEDALSGTNHEDPMLRVALAEVYVIWGRYEDALREYLWCLDEKYMVEPSYNGERSSFPLSDIDLISDIANLGQVYPPALEALTARNDTFLDQILNERIDTKISAYSYLNKRLGETEKIMQLYENLVQATEDRSRAIESVVFLNMKLFIEDKLYDPIVSNLDLVWMAKNLVKSQSVSLSAVPGVEPLSPDKEKEFREWYRAHIRGVLAEYYLVFLAASQEEEAQEIVSWALKSSDDAATYHALAEAGLKSAVPITENVQQAEKAVSMDPDNASYVNTYARLLHTTGRKEQAALTLMKFVGESEMTVKEHEMIHASLELIGVEVLPSNSRGEYLLRYPTFRGHTTNKNEKRVR